MPQRVEVGLLVVAVEVAQEVAPLTLSAFVV